MNPPQETAFGAADLLKLFSRYWVMALVLTFLSTALFIIAAEFIPRKYKSSFVLTIASKYFQNPLIRDIVPDVNDAAEMRAQREALIRQSLSHEFLDSLDRKYGLYSPEPALRNAPPVLSRALARLKEFSEKHGLLQADQPPADDSHARRELIKRIQIFNLNSMTFQVSFTAADPAVTLQATQDIHAQMVGTVLETRTRNLVTLRNAVRKRLESLAFNMNDAPDPRVSLRPQLLREELADVRNQLRAMGDQYTEEHPLIAELRERERVLNRWLDAAPRGGPGPSSEQGNAFSEDRTGASAREMYGDLTKKLDYLNIALESDKAQQGDYTALLESPIYPEAPLWPKKRLFALWGFAAGLFTSIFLAVARNYFERTTLHAEGLAERLGVPLLGALPVFPGRRPAR